MKYDINTCNVIDCTKCDLSINRKSIVNSTGEIHNGIFFIGEAPGYYEDKHGLPFVGDAGKLLNALLGLIGFDRTSAYVTNIIKCRPPDNRTANASEISNCKGYLSTELYIGKPKITVLLGGLALKTYFNNSKLSISQFRGYTIPVGNNYVIATYHPSYIKRNIKNDNLLKAYVLDFVKIANLYTKIVNPLHRVKF